MHQYQEQIQQIQQAILRAANILIVAHAKPDGDGLGAAMALSEYLRILNKKHNIFCRDSIPSQLQFLPGVERIEHDPSLFNEERELMIVVDSGDLVYAGVDTYVKDLRSDITIINIDHHISNSQFGRINLVDKEASSACELIWKFFGVLNFDYSKDAATCLLAGIISDTSNFSNPATTFYSLLAGSELLKKGARFPAILYSTLHNKTVSSLRLWGRILGRLEQNHKYDIAVTVIRFDDICEYEEKFEAIDGISNFLNNLTGARFVLILKEYEDGLLKGSLRTTRDDVDVSKIAELFGGGGHCRAAGFSMTGKIIRTELGWQVV